MEEVRWVTVDNISVVALIVGPLLAVIVARMLDARRARRARRMDVFRKLMATRRERLSFEHVSALNLVEVEFRDSPQVIKKWEEYLKELRTVHNKPKNETEENYQRRVFEKRDRLFTELLYEMAQTLGYKVQAIEILGSGYSPEGWGVIEDQQMLIRQYAVELFYGRKTLPITIYKEENNGTKVQGFGKQEDNAKQENESPVNTKS